MYIDLYATHLQTTLIQTCCNFQQMYVHVHVQCTYVHAYNTQNVISHCGLSPFSIIVRFFCVDLLVSTMHMVSMYNVNACALRTPYQTDSCGF